MLYNRKNYLGGKKTWLQGPTTSLIISAWVTFLDPEQRFFAHPWITPEYFLKYSSAFCCIRASNPLIS